MNFEYFIAKRIAAGRTEVYSRPVIRIAYLSIALGLAMMMISIAIVIGFKHSITNKVTGFASDISIVSFDKNESLEETPLTVKPSLLKKLSKNKEIKHIQLSAQKAGVLKTTEQIQGVILKGTGPNFDWSFLKQNLVKGSIPDYSEDSRPGRSVLISDRMANYMKLKTGDPLRVWFLGNGNGQTVGRKLYISGIYHTGLEEFDSRYIIGDLRMIQHLNHWKPDQVGSIEINIKNFKELKKVAGWIYQHIPFNMNINTITQTYPEIFNWLALLDTNVVVILILMIIVAAITIVSTLFILIIERTQMIGLLKTLGAPNKSIRKIFLYKASYIIGWGMFWGNILGLAFYFIQLNFHIFHLDPKSYYVSYVPVELSILTWFLLNLGTFVISMAILIGPSYYISKIQPANALRYE